MMSLRFGRVLGTAFVTALVCAASASAFTTAHLASDAAYLALAPVPTFVAGGQIGDGLLPAWSELDLGPETPTPPVKDQFEWPNGQPVVFFVAFEPSTRMVSFAVGARMLNYTAPPGGITDLFLRTRSIQDASMQLSNLVLNGVALGDASASAGNALDYLWIHEPALENGFALTGQATMSWTSTPPSQNDVLFQAKAGVTDQPVGVDARDWAAVKALYR